MPPHPRLRSPRQILRFVRIATLLALLLSNLAPALPSASAIERAQAAPDLSVSMVDALLDDRDGDGQADAGETVRYTLEIANQGTADALDVGVTVDLDPNTSLVPGSERVSPLALPDSYTALRDTPRTVPAPGVLANDSGLPAPTVVPASGPTAAGGTVSIAADGSFTYTPPAGFTGTDSFSYTATNELGSDTASVTISAEGAPRITGTTPADGAVEVPANSSITIVFDEPVNLDAQAITLGCPAPQPFTISPAAPASTFTIDPTGDLPASATCTVTITAALVTDADTLDPPDTLAADYTFSFTTTDAAPAVTSTTPANGATNVALDVTLTVEFSESVNVSASSFALSCGGPSLDYTLSATTGTSFTLDPTDDLPPGTMCSVTVVASEVSDTDAVDPPDTMAADYAFSFMTDAAPEVTSTTPANGATGVAVDANLVVEFSESVNVSASSFVLSCGGPSLDYTLSATTGTSFTLDPADDLPPTSNCTLTIVAAQIADTDPGDPPDVPIADTVVTFTTADPAPTVTSTTPANGATDVAVDANITVTFSESVSVSTSAFALSCGGPSLGYTLSATTGTSFTLDPADDLPPGTTCSVTVVASEVSDTDAVDPPDTLAADYVFSFTTDAAPEVTSTTPANGSTNVAVDANLVVEFSESVSVSTSAFALSCGGPSLGYTLSATTGTSFTLDPTDDLPVAADCSVTVVASEVSDTDAADPPDTLAADYVFSFTTVDVAPTVLNTTPGDGASDVAIDANLVVEFSESVEVSASSFVLSCGGPSLSYTLSATTGTSFTLDPADDLPPGTTCSVTVVASEVSDTDAVDPPDTLAADYAFSFMTDAAPEVTSTTPGNGASDVAVDANVVVEFSESVSVSTSSFVLSCGGPSLSYTLSATTGTSFTLDPVDDLPVAADCSVTVVASEVSDTDAVDPPDTLATDYVFSFTTADVAPTVLNTTPGNGAANVAVDANITVTFSESVEVSTSSFVLSCGGPSLGYTLSATTGTSFTLDPADDFLQGATCSVTVVASEVSDTDAVDPPQTMEADYTFGFVVDSAPEITGTTPDDGAANVATNANITVTFSEDVTVSGDWFQIICLSSGVRLPGDTVVSGGPQSYTIDPGADFAAGESCSVTIYAAQVADVDAGDPPDTLAANYVFSFEVDSPPSVTSTTPAHGAAGVTTDANITATFSEDVSVSGEWLQIACATSGTRGLSDVTVSGGPQSYTIDPNADFAAGESCAVTIYAAQVADVDAGDPPDTLVADYVFSFEVDAAPEVTSTTPGDGAANVATNASITVTFSEDVSVSGEWLQIACATSGTRGLSDVTVSGGPQSYTIDPSADFAVGESCSVTIYAARVADTDAADPPDTLAADYVFSFEVDSPPRVTSTLPANNATGVTLTSPITITFSESVAFSAASFALECHGSTRTFTLNTSSPATGVGLVPNGGLPAGATCTVTVVAEEIADADNGDPPDLMVADYTFTFSTPPVAADDSYGPIVGNIPLQVPDGASDLQANDQFMTLTDIRFGPTLETANSTLANGTDAISTVNLGLVVMMPNGAFRYEPAPGFEGTDEFYYQLTSPGGLDTARVQITVEEVIWFVDASAPGAGDGRFHRPYPSLDNLGEFDLDDQDDFIFIYSGSYDGNIVLEAGQRLIGQGHSLAAALSDYGVTLHQFQPAMPGQGTAPVLANTSGNLITLATDNDIRGVTLGGSAGIGINGSNFGTLKVRDVLINRTAQALNLSTGKLDAEFAGVTSSGGMNNIRLVDVNSVNAGDTLVLGGGTLSGATSDAFTVDGGDLSISYSGAILNVGGRQVRIVNKSGGTVTFSNTIDGDGTGVYLNNNPGASFVFTGGVNLDTGGNAAFTATNSGTVTVTGASNTITTRTGTGVNISNTTIGPGGVTFRSVSTNGAPNGIVLSNTGSGGFTISGVGSTDGSGGVIQQSTGAGVSLNNVTNVSLNFMKIVDGRDDGIRGVNVTGFTLNRSQVLNNGDAVGESGVELTGLLGDAAITNSTVSGSHSFNVRIDISSGTLNSLTVTDSTFNDTKASLNGEDGFFINLPPGGNGVVNTVSVTGSTFQNNRSEGVRVNVEGDGVVHDFTFTGNTVAGNGVGVNVSSGGNGDVTFNISNNPIISAQLTAINIANNGGAGSLLQGWVRDNSDVQSTTGSLAHAIWVVAEGSGSITVEIANNTISRFGLVGIDVQSRGGVGTNVNATITGNTISEGTGPEPYAGIGMHAGNGTSGENSRLCVNLANNNIAVDVSGTKGAIADQYLEQYAGTEFDIQGLTPPSGATASQVEGYVAGKDTNGAGAGVYVEPAMPPEIAVNYTAGDCDTPVAPLLAAGGEGAGVAEAQLTQAQLDSLAAAAVDRWAATGLPAADLARLRGVTLQVGDLKGGRLAAADLNRGSVTLDRDAAGWGWFVDATPDDDAEFAAGRVGDERRAAAGSPAYGRMDLLTVVAHELGHVLGRGDLPAGSQPHALMANTLPAGARRAPVPDAHLAAAPAATVTIPIGTLPAGKTVRVTFDVTVADLLPVGVAQLAAQASVAGSNVAAVLSDDPDVPGMADPTVTPVARVIFLPLLVQPGAPDLVVEQIQVTGSGIAVTIRNQGTEAVSQPFWVDLYISPQRAPTGVNQTWQMLGGQGAAWGVTGAALPLGPGEALTLAVGDAFYRPELSDLPAALAGGTQLYAQVDSANAATSYGVVYEGHEQRGGAYNNIAGMVVGAPQSALAAASGVAGRGAADGGLPPRPSR